MKRNKKLINLLIILILLCGLTSMINKIEKEKITANEEEILSLELEEINEISWSVNGDTFSFYRNEEWKYEEDESFPVDSSSFENVLSSLNSVISTFKIENVVDYSQYGIDNPECIINIVADEEITIKLGNFSEMDNQRYISIGNNIYLIKEDLYDSFNVELIDLMKIDEVPEMSTINKIEMEGKNNLEIIFEPDSDSCYTNEYSYFLLDNDNYLPVDDTQFDIFTNYIYYLELDNVITYNYSIEDASKYGMDDPDFTITFTYLVKSIENEFTIYITKVNSNYYANIKDSKFIYEIDEDTYTSISDTDYNQLRPDYIVELDWDIVESIEIELDDNQYNIEVFGDSDNLKFEYLDERIEFDDFVSELDSLSINEFNNETSNKKSECKIVIHQDKENFEKITIEFIQVDGLNCLVLFNNKSLGYIDRSDVIDLIEEINQVFLNIE